MIKENPKMEKKRRLLLAIPVLVTPFVTLMFWALGGGSGTASPDREIRIGLNTEVPGASKKENPSDKMAFYSQAEKDEQEKAKQLKNDPYYQMTFDSNIGAIDAQTDGQSEPAAPRSFSTSAARSYDPNERKVYEKLDALQSALAKQPQETSTAARYRVRQADNQGLSEDMQRLEQMMERMNSSSSGTDPEMKQVNDVLESILDLQHPERVQQRLKRTSEANRGNVYPVLLPDEREPISTLSNGNVGNPLVAASSTGNGFYGLDSPEGQSATVNNTAIRAIVHQTQTLVNGSTVKLRLLDAVYINGTYLPKDQFVFGTANLSGERLSISIASIRSSTQLFPVELIAYDMDGMEGIYIPGAITRDVAKQSGDRSLQGIGITTFDPSLGAQAASAGIELGKNLFGKKIKLVKVQVKAGYQIMLVDQKQNKNK